jgi:hypothetical protein
MKLNMKSQRKQTHNIVLTESGVFGLLCINFQKERVSITIDQKRSSPVSFFNVYFYTNFYKLEYQSFQRFLITKHEIKHSNSLSLSSFVQMRHLRFLFSSNSKNRTGRHLSLFDTGNLPLRLLSASDAPLHQLGYQPGRFCLIICLKSVTILR